MGARNGSSQHPVGLKELSAATQGGGGGADISLVPHLRTSSICTCPNPFCTDVLPRGQRKPTCMGRRSHRASELEGGTLEIQPPPFANQRPQVREGRLFSQNPHSQKASKWVLAVPKLSSKCIFTAGADLLWALWNEWSAVSYLCIQPGALYPALSQSILHSTTRVIF